MEISIQYFYRFKNGNTGFGRTEEEAIAEAIDSYGYSHDKRFQRFKLYSQEMKFDFPYVTMYRGVLIDSYNAKEIMARQLRTLAGL